MATNKKSEDVNIIRDQHGTSKAYFILSRETVQDESLSFEAIGVLVYLASQTDDQPIGYADIVRQSSEIFAKRIIKELTEAGYLSDFEGEE